MSEEAYEFLKYLLHALRFALPYDVHAPTSFDKRLLIGGIACPIAPKFFLPKAFTAFWSVSELAVLMGVPKTAMNEDNLPPVGKRKIRNAWQVFAVQPIPVA